MTKPSTTTKQKTQVVKNVENDCKTTSYNDDDSPEHGRGKHCIFPFKINDEKKKRNRIFHKCTTEVCDDCVKPWCSTQVDENGFHTVGKGNWGYCSEECLPDTKSTFVIRGDNSALVESTFESPIAETTIVTATSTERTSIEQSSKESTSIEVATVTEMPKKTSTRIFNKIPT